MIELISFPCLKDQQTWNRKLLIAGRPTVPLDALRPLCHLMVSFIHVCSPNKTLLQTTSLSVTTKAKKGRSIGHSHWLCRWMLQLYQIKSLESPFRDFSLVTELLIAVTQLIKWWMTLLLLQLIVKELLTMLIIPPTCLKQASNMCQILLRFLWNEFSQNNFQVLSRNGDKMNERGQVCKWISYWNFKCHHVEKQQECWHNIKHLNKPIDWIFHILKAMWVNQK